jgi:pimeloyl-ACP methyl ester carboxylesterase
LLTDIRPFVVTVGDPVIADLNERLERIRWPGQPSGSGWELGTDSAYLSDLCDYWRNRYDWRGFEARLNAVPQFLGRFEGEGLHFYHARSDNPDAQPLLLCHGWPSTAAEFLKVIGPLTGGTPSFHVVVPTIPGFGFSGPTASGFGSRRIAESYAALMDALGYRSFLVHGGDKGVLIAMCIAAIYPERVQAIHLTMVPAPETADVLTEEERRFLARAKEIAAAGMAYQQLHRTRPQTLAHGLADSPVGLASWLVEKYRAWTDCDGDVERRLSRDELLDVLSIYWLTNTIGSSIRLYYEDHGPGRAQPLPTVQVPVGHSHFPAEIVYTPRAWAERRYDIVYWKEMSEGGHFPAAEVPELFVGEMRSFLKGLTSP